MSEPGVPNIELPLDATEEELKSTSLTFYIGDTIYGLPLTNVVEIISVQPIAKVPGTPAYVKGVINLRGGIVPLVDVRLKFGQPEKEYDEFTNVIITVLNDMTVGLVVDRVANVVRSESVDISQLPEFSTVNTNRYMTSVSRTGDNLIMNLNCETILEDDNILNLA
ncbi:chemotaxis protein CheW [Ruminococcaceae bacterium OttesenSCG-928-I18]|nr:chemotaxis protein CheW [Ruminococcaceae bacterium OttesenSCG-928-I18]